MGEPGDVVTCHSGAVLAQFTPPFAEPEDQLFAGHGHRYWPGLGQHSPLVVLEGDPAETRHQVLPALAVLSRFEARAQPARCRDLDLMAGGGRLFRGLCLVCGCFLYLRRLRPAGVPRTPYNLGAWVVIC